MGPYAFTTLRPQLGAIRGGGATWPNELEVVRGGAAQQGTAAAEAAAEAAAAAPAASLQMEKLGSTSSSSLDSRVEAPLIIADLPGLLPGAHAGRGRGTAFLAHVQRARCLALVVDMAGSGDSSGGSPSGTESDLDGKQEACKTAEATAAAAGQPDSASSTDEGESSSDKWVPAVPYAAEEQLKVLQVRGKSTHWLRHTTAFS